MVDAGSRGYELVLAGWLEALNMRLKMLTLSTATLHVVDEVLMTMLDGDPSDADFLEDHEGDVAFYDSSIEVIRYMRLSPTLPAKREHTGAARPQGSPLPAPLPAPVNPSPSPRPFADSSGEQLPPSLVRVHWTGSCVVASLRPSPQLPLPAHAVEAPLRPVTSSLTLDGPRDSPDFPPARHQPCESSSSPSAPAVVFTPAIGTERVGD